MDIKKQLIKAYDKDAGLREGRDGHKRSGWKKDEVEAFARLLEKENKKTILELGCGIGIDSRFFAKEGFEVLATDLSPKMVEKCKASGIEAQVLDYYNLDTLEGKFDAVFSMNVLLHTPRADLQKVLKGISEVLNPRGVFYYGVYGGNDNERVIYDETRMSEDRFFSFLSKETLLKAVDQCFEVIDYYEIEQESEEEGFVYQSLTLRKKN